MKKPVTMPASARSAVAPVADAFVRNTDSVPSTTEDACWTLETSATATAAARAAAPRALFRNQSERMLACLMTTRAAPSKLAMPRSGMCCLLVSPAAESAWPAGSPLPLAAFFAIIDGRHACWRSARLRPRCGPRRQSSARGAVTADAAFGPITAAKKTANATRIVTSAAAHATVLATVPMMSSTLPATAKPKCARSWSARVPAEPGQHERGKPAERGKERYLRVPRPFEVTSNNAERRLWRAPRASRLALTRRASTMAAAVQARSPQHPQSSD